ncbi:MAG: hypothetical protein M3Q95_10685 [Bacteroidota bacterium]|nr:hypothetical protein [Bacteroidota bacterium]
MSSNTPDKYRHDLEVVRDTARQVMKDFGMAGIEINFSGNPQTAYQELVDQALPALKGLYQKNTGAFMALLYRIDVEEYKVKKLSDTASGNDFFSQLAALVIEREFMKVLIRKLFSSRNG